MPLEIKEISKRIDDRWVLRNVSFTAVAGRIFGIFGPEGSGRSALLRILAGSEKSNGGSVVGLDAKAPVIISAVPDVSFLNSVFGRSKLSGDGEAAAAAITAELDRASKLLLLDNAFACLDVPLKEELFGKIRNAVHERDITVIFGTGDFSEILEFCDDAAVILNGEIKQTGAPQAIYDDPGSAAIAAITGRNNLIEARRLSSSKAEIPEFQTIDGEHRLVTQKIERSGLGALNQNVILGIRPEQISISFGASFPEDNLIKASIAAIKPLGAATRVELDSNGLRLEALVTRLIGLNIGDECMLGLPPDRIRVYKN